MPLDNPPGDRLDRIERNVQYFREGSGGTSGLTDEDYIVPTPVNTGTTTGPVKNDPNNPPYEPISPGVGYDDGTGTTDTTGTTGVTLQDLYPNTDGQEIVTPELPTIDQPRGARLSRANKAWADIDAQSSTKTEDQNADFELNRMMSESSPLMERAKQQAMQQSNRRGLLNSSIAVGAAQGAMVDRMMPMALQNSAQNYGRENLNTQFRQQSQELEAQLKVAMEQGDQQAATQIAMQKAELDRNWQIQMADQEFKANQQAADAQNRLNEQTQQQINDLNQQFLDGQQKLDLAVHNNAHALLMQNNQSAQMYNNTFMTGVANIMNNNDMSPAQKASAVKELIRARDSAFETLIAIEETDIDEDDGAGTAPNGQDVA